MKKNIKKSTTIQSETVNVEPRSKQLLRDRPISFSLNDSEYKAFQKYCLKYKISNRSRFIRETMMKAILTRMTEDYPTLFGEKEMR